MENSTEKLLSQFVSQPDEDRITRKKTNNHNNDDIFITSPSDWRVLLGAEWKLWNVGTKIKIPFICFAMAWSKYGGMSEYARIQCIASSRP